MVADPGLDAGCGGAALDHDVGVGRRQGGTRQLLRATADGAEQWPPCIVSDAGAIQVGVEVFLQQVMAGHLVPLTALLL